MEEHRRIMKTFAIIVVAAWTGIAAFGQTPAAPQPQPPPAAAPATPSNKSEQPATETTQTTTSAAPAATEASSANTIEYVGADIQDVLRTLARQAGLNLVMGEDISGKVTISLIDV